MDVFHLAFLGKLVFIALLYLILYVVMRTVRQEVARFVPPPLRGRDVGLGYLSFVTAGDDRRFEPGLNEALNQEEISIGADPTNDLFIDDHFVSAHHARLRWDGSQWFIEDLNSTNGTFINNRPLSPGRSWPVPFNADVHLGTQVVFQLIK